jgi:dipeptidyl aminopeptidase/acylaminoacyl peptidase
MPKRPIRADDLLKIVTVGDPQVSPDGSKVLFTKKTINAKNKTISNLVTVDMEGRLVQWTQGETGNGGGRWSPDGGTIAFISGREKFGQIHRDLLGRNTARWIQSHPLCAGGNPQCRHAGHEVAGGGA